MTDRTERPSYSRGDSHDALRGIIRERAAEARTIALEGLGKQGRGMLSVRRDSRSSDITFSYSGAATMLVVPSHEFGDMIRDYDHKTEFAACLRFDYSCLAFRFADLGLPDNHDVEPAKIEPYDDD